MRNKIILVSFMLCAAAPAPAQISIGVELPHVSIGVNLPLYPDLVPVPGYPVYYAPRLDSNYFFYDGMYWVYEDDNWYASSWYNGPWDEIDREVVPAFVLRIPVRYYRHQPAYFRGWRADAPPRWNDHWGHDWAQQRNGWDRWDRKAPHARPPLPAYQRKFSGDKYPRPEQQRVLENKNYKYRPRDPAVRQQHDAPHMSNAPARAEPNGRPEAGRERREPNDRQRSGPPQADRHDAPAPREQAPQRDHQQIEPRRERPRPPEAQRQPPAQPAPKREAGPQGDNAPQEPRPRQQPRQEEAPGQRPAPEARGKEATPEQRQGPRQERGRDREKPDDRGDEHGPERRK